MVDTLDCTVELKRNSSKGAAVKTLQTHLKTLGYYTYASGKYLKIDGDFAYYTKQAVKAFQKATGNYVDGVVGPKTCAALNKKILEKNGIKTTEAAATPAKPAATTNTQTTKQAAAAPKPDPLKIDTSKNVYKVNEANIHIQGLHFIMSAITFNNAFRGGNWKQLELTNGTVYSYLGKEQPRSYNIEIYLTHDQFNQLKTELYKLQAQVCRVASDEIESGNYTIKIDVANQKLTHKKLTFKLTEAK